ncbi:hypothetical protein EYF80_012218 [Liparis tanakae]|uniref:Uncharacterized protein n=1 Tax=Liparis tanakae TaxID=230148 RepID=A0A4Z2IID5_9TELE|nr:hypothetical protein EYF80_012218 [Liparis tanakae]
MDPTSSERKKSSSEVIAVSAADLGCFIQPSRCMCPPASLSCCPGDTPLSRHGPSDRCREQSLDMPHSVLHVRAARALFVQSDLHVAVLQRHRLDGGHRGHLALTLALTLRLTLGLGGHGSQQILPATPKQTLRRRNHDPPVSLGLEEVYELGLLGDGPLHFHLLMGVHSLQVELNEHHYGHEFLLKYSTSQRGLTVSTRLSAFAFWSLRACCRARISALCSFTAFSAAWRDSELRCSERSLKHTAHQWRRSLWMSLVLLSAWFFSSSSVALQASHCLSFSSSSSFRVSSSRTCSSSMVHVVFSVSRFWYKAECR